MNDQNNFEAGSDGAQQQQEDGAGARRDAHEVSVDFQDEAAASIRQPSDVGPRNLRGTQERGLSTPVRAIPISQSSGVDRESRKRSRSKWRFKNLFAKDLMKQTSRSNKRRRKHWHPLFDTTDEWLLLNDSGL
ncbi:unnamed protein product [Anisakis simplex]|uniref:Uncharacterized protein n=1 Tax=Anisakis simplex TaxID=6269 RepID=A0A0M3J452_ANISI|nr:unnamed protein product [Anisakis simplex]